LSELSGRATAPFVTASGAPAVTIRVSRPEEHIATDGPAALRLGLRLLDAMRARSCRLPSSCSCPSVGSSSRDTSGARAAFTAVEDRRSDPSCAQRRRARPALRCPDEFTPDERSAIAAVPARAIPDVRRALRGTPAAIELREEQLGDPKTGEGGQNAPPNLIFSRVDAGRPEGVTAMARRELRPGGTRAGW
jgi:hypothetical protein